MSDTRTENLKLLLLDGFGEETLFDRDHFDQNWKILDEAQAEFEEKIAKLEEELEELQKDEESKDEEQITAIEEELATLKTTATEAKTTAEEAKETADDVANEIKGKQDLISARDDDGNLFLKIINELKDSDYFPILSDDELMLIAVSRLSEYWQGESILPQTGGLLEDYTSSQLINIFNSGVGQYYFEIGDKMPWESNELTTTAQIAAFNWDVIDPDTNKKANASFILNQYFIETEITSPWMSTLSDWTPNSAECLASSIFLQKDGLTTAKICPDWAKDGIVECYKYPHTGAWVENETDVMTKHFMFVVGAYEVYGTTTATDKETLETVSTHYPLLSSTAVNKTAFGSVSSNSCFVRQCAATTNTVIKWLSNGGGIITATSTFLATAYGIKQIPIGFCMGSDTE